MGMLVELKLGSKINEVYSRPAPAVVPRCCDKTMSHTECMSEVVLAGLTA